jgi:hypothetical protein
MRNGSKPCRLRPGGQDGRRAQQVATGRRAQEAAVERAQDAGSRGPRPAARWMRGELARMLERRRASLGAAGTRAMPRLLRRLARTSASISCAPGAAPCEASARPAACRRAPAGWAPADHVQAVRDQRVFELEHCSASAAMRVRRHRVSPSQAARRGQLERGGLRLDHRGELARSRGVRAPGAPALDRGLQVDQARYRPACATGGVR